MVNRAHPRYAVAARVEFVIATGTVEGQTENVSRGGLCADLTRPVPLGEGVVARLALIFAEDELSETIEVGGRVVWCTPINEKFQVGIQFTNLTPDAVKDLELFLRFLAARPT